MIENIVKSAISGALTKAARNRMPTVVTGRLTRPVMQQALRKTYVEVLKKEMANGTAQEAVRRASTAAFTKGAAQLTFIEKVTGRVASAAVGPLVESARSLSRI